MVITVEARAGATTVSDRFFVRRTVVDPAIPAATSPTAREGVVATPVRTLGTLTVTAPTQLEAFATVSGDANPIHRSDVLARFVGLPGRIVHGMWTSAAATRAVLESAAQGDPTRLREWTVDFVAPVLPGQDVTFTVTRTGLRDGARIVAVEATTVNGVVAVGSAVVAPPRTVYVFPGQGIQSQGMGMEAYARSAAARSVWDRADAITRERMGFSILEVVRDNPTSIDAVGTTYRHPAGVLHLTQFTQVAMATLAQRDRLRAARGGGVRPRGGRRGALGRRVQRPRGLQRRPHARGSHRAGLRPWARHARPGPARRRRQLRVPPGRGPTASGGAQPRRGRGASSPALLTDTGALCEIVNHNLRGKQYAVAGTLESLGELERRIGPGQPGRAPMLLVPGIDVPFHSSALLGGVQGFRKQLIAKLPDHIDTEALVGRYIPNLYPHVFRIDREYVQGVHDVSGSPILADLLADWDAAIADRDALARTLLVELLAWQFASPVRWIETFELMCAPVELGGLGAERIVEIGVGAAPTLANLAKGSLALPTHRGTRPEVLNVEVDADEVLDTVRRSHPGCPGSRRVPRPPPRRPRPPPQSLPDAAESPVAAGDSDESGSVRGAEVADLPVGHATAVAALLALRVGVRVDQLENDSIESLVDGASSRRNQVLMDIGKEFAVSAMDGAHEVPLGQLTDRLAEKTAGYRYPGPVLSAAVEGAVTAALGPRGSSQSALTKRVTTHWGLGEGWVARTALALALGTREGGSRRGGDLTTLAAETAEGLIDEAVRAAGAEAGVQLAPVVAAAAGGGTVDAAAVKELRDHVEGLLADQASDVLARLGRVPVADPARCRLPPGPCDARAARGGARPGRAGRADLRSAPARDARLGLDLGPRRRRPPGAGPSGRRGRRAHLGAPGRPRRPDRRTPRRRAADPGHPRVPPCPAGRFRRHQRCRRPDRAMPVTRARSPRSTAPWPRPLAGSRCRTSRSSAGRWPTATPPGCWPPPRRWAEAPGDFRDEVALVTGASPNSIAWTSVAHLLRGGATVVLATTTDTPERIAAYRDLERRYSGPGARLHVVRANLASFADIDALVDWMVTPTTEDLGPITREVKPALWPTLVLPFAAAPAMGELPDTGRDAQLTLAPAAARRAAPCRQPGRARRRRPQGPASA